MKSINDCWYIAGIGAVGTLVASCFYQNTLPIKLLLKNKTQLLEYQSFGLNITSGPEKYICQPIAIDIHTVREKIKRLIICVKAYDVKNVLSHLQGHLDKESIIILIHNGLGVLEEIKQQWPYLRIISGVNNLGAYTESRFHIKAFLKGKLYLGIAMGKFSRDEIIDVKNTFHQAHLNCRWQENIYPLMWEKFSANCSINILTALFACKNGELLNHRDILEKITAEIMLVLKAYEVKISAQVLLQKIVQLVTDTADNYSSMNRDVANNRRTELAYLNQYLLKLAQQKNIAVPVNEALLQEFYIKFPILL